MHQRGVLGAELRLIAPRRLAALVDAGLLPQSTEAALQRIHSVSGCTPNLSGSNVQLLEDMRDRIETVIERNAKYSSIRNRILITAPHTHWSPGEVITIRRDRAKNRYLIGSLEIEPDDYYRPVSYIFNRKRPCCFEWILDERNDDGINIFEEFVKECCDDSSRFWDVFGLSLDYRSELSQFDGGSTLEIHETDKVSAIYALEDVLPEDDDPSVRMVESVAWRACRSPTRHGFQGQEQVLRDEIVAYISQTANLFERHRRMRAVIRALEER